MGLKRVLDCAQDDDSDVLLEPIESAFDDVDRELANFYTRIRLSQFSCPTRYFNEQISFNFNDLKPNFINKLSS
jgi:hypothetical protein